MRRFALLLLLACTTAALAQSPVRVRGTITSLLVPPGTPIVAFDPGSRADLKPGEWIWTNARQEADGKIVSERLNVSKRGVKPPH